MQNNPHICFGLTTYISRKLSGEQMFLDIFLQKQIFSWRPAKISCHPNIFTKMTLFVFTLSWQVLPSVLGNLMESKILLIFAKIFAKIFVCNLCITHRASLFPQHVDVVQILNNDRCIGLLLFHNVISFNNTETFFTIESNPLVISHALLHYDRWTGYSAGSVWTSHLVGLRMISNSESHQLRSVDCGQMAVDQHVDSSKRVT